MRYKEFELTEDELFELKMSPTNLRKMAAETGAVAGIEFEMYVPNASEADEDEYGSEPDYEMDESFPTGRGYQSEVIDFFRGGDGGSPRSTIQRALDVLSEDYWSWKEENFEGWFNDNDSLLDDYLREELPQDQDESDEEYIERLGSNDRESERARDRAMERVREDYDQEDQWEEFLSDNDIRSMSDFGNNYDLEWPYYNYPESGGGNIDINDVASDFQSAIGRRVKSGGYHSGASSQTDNYRVETDSSLSEPNDPTDGGLEFISPPLPLDEMLSDLEKVVKWAARNDCYTNSTTGLHMNVSVPGFELSKLDYVKLAIFLGDEYVLDQFGRAGNSYCQSAMENIRKIARTQPDKVMTMLQQMQGNLSAMASKIVHTGTTNKYTSINTQDGYIEFRSPGGDWLGEYAADPGKINNTLLRFTVALDVAMKPEAFRQEYMKKLYKTLSLGESNDTIQFFARYAAGDLPQSALKSFVKQAQIQRKAKKLLPGAIKGQQLIQWQATSGAATTKVVARTEEEARKKAAVNIGIPFTDRAIDTMDIQPLDLYTGPVNQYNIIRDDTGFDLGAFEGVDERDAITNFRVQKPQWSSTDVTARRAAPEPSRTGGGGFSRAPHTSIYRVINSRGGSVMVGFATRTFASTVELANRAIEQYGIPSTDTKIVDFNTDNVYNLDGSIYRTAPAAQDGTSVPGSTQDQEFSGTWEVVSRPTDEVVHTISGIGNSTMDAERHAEEWVDQTGFSDPVYVRPRMQPRTSGGGGFDRAPHTSIYQLVDNRDGRILLGGRHARGETRTFAYAVEMAGLAIRSYGVPSGDIRIVDMATNRSYNIDGSPANTQTASQDGTPVPGSTEYLNRSLAAQQASAQGTESLPPGNARWLVLDRNGREVYSFVNTTAQSDANQYARQWLSANAQDGQGPYDVVPVSR